MRKLTFFLLMSTAAAPALAAPEDGHFGRPRDNQSSEQSDNRPQRAQESQPERSDEQRAFRATRSEDNQSERQGVIERIREQHEQQQVQREQRSQVTEGQSSGDDGNRAWRRGDSSATSSGWRPRERQVRTIPDTHPSLGSQVGLGDVARTFEGRHRRDYRDGNYTRWSRDHWRGDRRYDWWNYRNRHRSLFRIGIYYDPFGWRYRPWSIGSFLYPSYYGSNYWLDDPWQYRLPPAYGPYRWVRYWDDALLVNIYTGEVVDVIHNFFW